MTVLIDKFYMTIDKNEIDERNPFEARNFRKNKKKICETFIKANRQRGPKQIMG